MLSKIKKIAQYFSVNTKQYNDSRWWLGMLLVIVLAGAAVALSKLQVMQSAQFSSLTLGIVLGIIVGNSVFSRIATHTDVGVNYAKSTLLKAGIILFGFRITFSQVAGVGLTGLVTDITVLSGTFMLALSLGKYVFKLDEHTTILIGAGSSICGAAAVMATEPVIKAQEHKVSVAVATVVVFGTLSMFTYPLLFEYMGMTEHAYGIFIGSTIHEVAQVVAAGSAVSENATDTAVIEKMLRVMMLAPFLLCLSYWQNKKNSKVGSIANSKGNKSGITIPWFAVLFIATSGVHSLSILPQATTSAIVWLDNILLTIAMVALGLRTHIGAIRQAGIKPLLLALCLFLFLTLGGYAINIGIAELF
ncbi:YeiH family putative sulfate export transporter [Pseudoalteromonas sp. SG45-5]|uniref:YeiH family protein n=1 Tax=unclassified Pseudoalteromonas TaxID=194690 RepID=UPI0015FE469B|nr:MULTISPECIES: YeiH family protein [unclassified Pseudoalteromonas]MBB1387225.1 YeiH family putative sulfate export transporter [Pseudoalteromonas sp. SG45-5]MBB1395325.1 YeiH family putative sulfate export transporter [Pseudoalteromonas sp. SG44-4]MBB1447488.1 YeiH family putative sulfate export transporter [Pseudoalteromonas sp. SG41-6]